MKPLTETQRKAFGLIQQDPECIRILNEAIKTMSSKGNNIPYPSIEIPRELLDPDRTWNITYYTGLGTGKEPPVSNEPSLGEISELKPTRRIWDENE